MADSVAGKVIYKLELDTRQFDKELDKGRKAVKSLGKDAEASSKRMDSAIGNVAKKTLKDINKGFIETRIVADQFGKSTVKSFTEVTSQGKRVIHSQEDIAQASKFLRNQMTGNIGAVVSSLEGMEKKTRRVKKETSSFRREIAESANAVRSLQTAFSGFSGAAMIGAITVGAGVLVELAGAAVAASGALLTVPAAAAVAGAAIGTAKVALLGMDDAFKALADGDIEKLNESLQNLSPNAQRFVLAAKGFKDAFDPVRRVVQDNLFANLDSDLKRITDGGAKLLEGAMGRVATSMNGVLREAAKLAESPVFKGLIERTSAGTSQAIDTLKGALQPIAQVLERVVTAGMPFIQMFAQWVVEAAKSAAEFLNTNTGMEALNKAIETGISVVGQILGLVSSLATTFGALFSASSASGSTLIQTLTGIIDKFNAWATSAEGQEKLANLFSFLNKVLEQSLIIIGAVAGVVLNVLNFISSLPAPVQTFIAQMVALGIVMTPVILFVSKFVTSLMALGPVFTLASKLFTSAGGQILRFGTVVLQIATKIGGFLLRLAAQALLAGARIALSFIIAMGPIGWVIAIIIGLVALVILNFDKIKKFIVGVWNTVSSWTSKTWNSIKRAVVDGWNRLVSAVSGGVSRVVAFVRGLPRKILGALGNTGRMLWDAGKNILQGLGNGIQSAVDGVKNKLKEFASGALDTIKGFFGIKSPSRVMAQMGKYMMQGFGQGIDRNASLAERAAKRASQATFGALNGNMAIDPSLAVGAATSLRVRSDGLFDGGTTSASQQAPVTNENHFHFDGMYAKSRADFRDLFEDGIEAINEARRAKRLPEIGGTA